MHLITDLEVFLEDDIGSLIEEDDGHYAETPEDDYDDWLWK